MAENPHCYILLSEAFKAANEGATNGANILRTATTKDGRIVVSANALNDFAELFIDRTRITTLWLTSEDFNIETFNPNR